MKKLVPQKLNSKKTLKKSKTKLQSSNESMASAEVHQNPSKQIVHAYETTHSLTPRQNAQKVTKPKQKFSFQFAPSIQTPSTRSSASVVSGGGGNGVIGNYVSEAELSYAFLPTPQQLDDSHYYYSIAELENLNMLDHRHPEFHRQQKELQQQQKNSLKIYHQQLLLQLPPNASQSSSMEMSERVTAPNDVDSSAMPIYEAPQIVALTPVNNTALRQLNNNMDNINKSNSNTSLSINDNNNKYDKSQQSLISNIIANVSGEDIDNNMLLNDAGLLPIDMLLRYRIPKVAAAAAASRKSLIDQQKDNDNSLTKSKNTINFFTSALRTNKKMLIRSHSVHPHVAYVPAARCHDAIIPMLPKIDADFLDQAFAEQSIIGARASVMVYDDTQKKWVPSGSSSGLSKVQIYHHQQNNTFRVVGRKLQDHEVVINCSILKGLKYNQATATFHQWRDSKYVYGLNFSSQQDAEAFARAMMHALEVLSGRVPNNAGQPTNGNSYEEDMGYRTMTSEDAAILRQQQQITGQVTPSAQTPTSQTNQNNIPQSPPTPQQTHHRTSSAPPAPQPQQMSMPPQQQQLQQQQPTQQQQQLYAQVGSGPTQQNGMMLQQQQPQQQQQQPQMPQAPTGQTQYHTPQQQQQQQMQQQPTQQQQPQQLQQHHPVYSSQQMVNQNYQQQQQQQNQYQQPHYVLSSSNPNLNLHQYSQQQPGAPQPPMPPPHQLNGPGVVGGPIYVPSQPPPPSQGIPTSASSNSVVYASQQQMLGGGPPMPPQGMMSQNMQNGPPAPPQPNTAPGYGHLNGPLSQSENTYGHIPAAPPMMGQNSGVPMPPPLNRMSSGGPTGMGAPAAPPPPPAFGGAPPAPQMFNGNAGSGAPPPPAPPAPPAMGPGGPAAPPPPPPPPIGGMAAKKDDPAADLMGSLAAQLQMAKLKKNKSSLPPAENSGSSTSSGGSGNYGTIGRSSNGMASMMDEMAKTLARRRAQAEKKEPEPEPEVKQRPWEKSNTLPHKLGSSTSSNGNSNSRDNTSNSGSESPRPMRKRFGSASEETILKQVNGDGLSLALSGDLDSLKAEIVREMRLEIQKVKQEIIDAIKSEFNRR